MSDRFSSHRGLVVYYASGPCGSGKTLVACKHIRDDRFDRNHLYVAPSRALVAQTADVLTTLGVKSTAITSDSHADHVKKGIVEFMKGAQDHKNVLLITWNAYVDLPYVNRRENWATIIDEVPQLDRFYGWKLPRNLAFLADHVDLESSINDQLARVVVKDRKGLEDQLEAQRDDVDEMFRPFFRDLLSPNKDMFVELDSWNRLAENGGFSDDESANRLFFISMLRPDPFRNAILLGANLQDSLMYRWLTSFHGCRFEEHRPIASQLRSMPEALGSRLKVSFLIPGRHASKTLYAKPASTNANLIDAMDQVALEAFGSEDFLYVSNNGRKSILNECATAFAIPVVSHGLNQYARYSNIYFSAALNREPQHFAMLKALGLDSDVVHKATAHEMLYQCVMRTSLRDPNSSAKVHAIVPDEPSACRLAELVRSREVTQLGSLVAPAVKPLNPTQKDQRHEARKSLDRLMTSRNAPRVPTILVYKRRRSDSGYISAGGR